MSKYDEDLRKAFEILDNVELDELLKVAVEAMDNAAVDIGMEANQEWHAKITLESALIHIAENIANQPQLTIPKSVAEKIDKFIKVLHFPNEFESIKFLSSMDLNGDRTPQWLKDNPMLVFAYLAGKALGVDLVKVVEG